MIKQEELLKFRTMQKQVDDKKKAFKVVEAALDDMENALIGRIEAKEAQEKGQMQGVVKIEKGRASIQWKEEVVKLKGKAFVERLLLDAHREDVKSLEVIEVTK